MAFARKIWSAVFLVVALGEMSVLGDDTPAGVIPCEAEGFLHTCEDGSCIHDANVCDGFKDCPDGSDERLFANVTSEDGYECSVKNDTDFKCFLPKKYVCDQVNQCTDDECNCSHQGPFQCSPNECVDMSYFCDGRADCNNKKDEAPYRGKEDGIKCYSHFMDKPCGLPVQYRCNGKKDCIQGGDECFCGSGVDGGYDNTSIFDDTCFRCLDGMGEMLSPHVCNGFIACADLSDECLCPDPIPICKQLAYEENCEFRCRPGEIGHNGTECINKTQICDGKRDCFYGEDEKFCQRVYTVKRDLLFDYYEDTKEFWCCNAGYPADCLYEVTYTNETYDGCEKFYRCKKDPLYMAVVKYGIACDGNPSCTGSDDECANCTSDSHFCEDSHKYGFDCPNSSNPTPLMHSAMCDGIADCNETLGVESYDEANCPGRFYCDAVIDGHPYVSLDNSLVCDCINDCTDGSDEANCTSYSNFCCRNNGGEAVSKNEVCNGIEDCTDGSDECQSCISSPFADDKHLISNKALRAFVWIIGICSSLGNLYVFIFTILNIYRRSQQDFAKITSFHVAALSLADFCVGVYLVSLGAVDARYAGKYCHEDKAWRSGDACNFLGVLSMFGTQASVFMLTLMTLNRLHVVLRPFSKPNVQRPIVFISLFLLLGLLIALIPVVSVFEDYFTSHIRLKRNPFLLGDVDRQEFSDFANKLVSYGSDSHDFKAILGEKRPIYPWKNLLNVMEYLNDTFEARHHFGYYSSHGVCLPKLFPVRSDPSWQYSITLIVINFTAFFVIFISYIALYRQTLRTRNNAGKCNAARSQQSLAIERKITRIIATDFCCWMPICVIAFLKIAGVQVSDEVYAIAAIVILPINSAINPFLYSNLPEAIWKKTGKAYFTKSDTAKSVTTENTGVELQRVSVKRKSAKTSGEQ